MPSQFFAKNFQTKVENRKSKHRHRILYIRNSIDTRFQVELTIFTFWTKLVQKEYFKTKKTKTNIEFYIFELV